MSDFREALTVILDALELAENRPDLASAVVSRVAVLRNVLAEGQAADDIAFYAARVRTDLDELAARPTPLGAALAEAVNPDQAGSA